MAPVTPADWLPVLADRLDKRMPRVSLLRSYVNGQAPLPEMGRNTRAAWIAFQKKARTNFGGIACSSHADRIRAQGVRVGSDDRSDSSLAARRIWRDNRLAVQISDAVWDMESASVGYLVVGLDEGRALVTSERPEMFYAEPDAVRPWRSRAAIKVWRDDVEGIDHATVWAGGVKEWFTRPSGVLATAQRMLTAAGGEWTSQRSDPYTGNLPVYILDRRDGLALIEPHIDVIDRINLGKLQRLTTAAIQAFKQRAVKGDLPEVDAAGNKIDWAAVFEPSPGALWELPEGIDIWESATTDIRPMLDAEKQDARDFGAATGTPISMLLPDSANQTAEGASNTTAQQVMACRYDIERLQPAVSAVMATALQAEGFDLAGETVEVDFLDPERVTLAEQMDAFTKATAAGVSLVTAQKNILQWSQDQIEEDERNRRRTAGRAGLQALMGATPVV